MAFVPSTLSVGNLVPAVEIRSTQETALPRDRQIANIEDLLLACVSEKLRRCLYQPLVASQKILALPAKNIHLVLPALF